MIRQDNSGFYYKRPFTHGYTEGLSQYIDIFFAAEPGFTVFGHHCEEVCCSLCFGSPVIAHWFVGTLLVDALSLIHPTTSTFNSQHITSGVFYRPVKKLFKQRRYNLNCGIQAMIAADQVEGAVGFFCETDGVFRGDDCV